MLLYQYSVPFSCHYSIVYDHFIFSLSFFFFLNGYLDCFQFGTIIDCAAVNILVHVFLWMHVYISVGHIARS